MLLIHPVVLREGAPGAEVVYDSHDLQVELLNRRE